MPDLNRYRPWFFAAAVYNVLWGSLVALFPNAIFRWLGMPLPNYPQLFQCIGMIVGVYGYAYWLIARNPERYGPLVYVGLLGKVLGPLGFLVAAVRGELPWAFGWVNVFNDLIWLPAFIGFALVVWRRDRLG